MVVSASTIGATVQRLHPRRRAMDFPEIAAFRMRPQPEHFHQICGAIRRIG